jgi:hypothetical protein
MRFQEEVLPYRYQKMVYLSMNFKIEKPCATSRDLNVKAENSGIRELAPIKISYSISG